MKPVDVVKLVDEEFYHLSERPLPVGDTLVSRGSAGYTPRVVDDARPIGTPPRNAHLFMVKDPTCAGALGMIESEEFIYKVTPTAPVVKADFEWLVRASGARDQRVATQAAENYWSGRQVDKRMPCSTEYLTMAFRVDDLVSEPHEASFRRNVPRRPPREVGKAKKKAR